MSDVKEEKKINNVQEEKYQEEKYQEEKGNDTKQENNETVDNSFIENEINKLDSDELNKLLKQVKLENYTQYRNDRLVSFRRSEDITLLIKSLIAFHSEFQDVEKAEENPFFNSRYADLSAILKVARPILSKHNLTLLQFPISGHQAKGKSIAIKTILFHESGQFIESDGVEFEPSKYDIQQIGSIETYIRRYGVQSLLMVSFKCEDDDGNKAVETTTNKKAKSSGTTKANRL